MSNTIGFRTVRNQDANIPVPILSPHATTLGKDRIELPLRVPAWEQQGYWHALTWRAIVSVNASDVRLLPQASSRDAALGRITVPYRPSPSFESYMELVSNWASAFDEEAAGHATRDLESLYDDAYFEALELQKKLP